MRHVMIASCYQSDICREITGMLRKALSGGQVSYYCGLPLERLRERDTFDLSETAFLLLGLSTHGHSDTSPDYLTERDLIRAAFTRKIPVGIVCNGNGGITTPCVTKDDLARISLVISNGRNDACHPSEVYPKAGVLDLTEDGVDKIVAFIVRQLPPAPQVMREPVRQPQMVAANTGWQNSNMTD